MSLVNRLLLTGCLCTLLITSPVSALETDQYTVPERPLFDIGPQFQHKMSLMLRDLANRTNATRDDYLDRARDAASPSLARYYKRKAAETLTDDYMAKLVRDEIGSGVIECPIELWAIHTDFGVSPTVAAFAPHETVYGNVHLAKYLMFVYQSPTVNMYGVYFGTDKLGHFAQTGHDYYLVYRQHLRNGESEAQATAAAVALGVSQEHGWYGEAMEGIFSNGDLASNYAGLKFYINLTEPVTIAGRTRPPILLRDNDRWQINPAAGSNFMRVFVTDHWNEAMNPNHYSSDMLEDLRSAVRERSAAWMKFYETTPAEQAEQFKNLQLWYNEDYGRCDLRDQILMQDFEPR